MMLTCMGTPCILYRIDGVEQAVLEEELAGVRDSAAVILYI